jgi:hypothetical protein
MKVRKINGLFDDIDPFCELIEGLSINDFDIKVAKSTPKPDEAIDTKSAWKNSSISAAVYLILKPESTKELESLNVNDVKEYIFKYDSLRNVGIEEKVYYISDYIRHEVKFTGLRTKEKKKQKYLKVFNDFMEDFKSKTKDQIVKELIDLANERLERKLNNSNEKFEREHVDLYTDNRYENAWKTDWNEDENLKSLKSEKEKIAEQISKLEKELSDLSKKEKDVKIEIGMKSLEDEGKDLPQSVKDKIKEKFDSKDVWRHSGIRRRGF